MLVWWLMVRLVALVRLRLLPAGVLRWVRAWARRIRFDLVNHIVWGIIFLLCTTELV